jgi:hypothetical protein
MFTAGLRMIMVDANALGNVNSIFSDCPRQEICGKTSHVTIRRAA